MQLTSIVFSKHIDCNMVSGQKPLRLQQINYIENLVVLLLLSNCGLLQYNRRESHLIALVLGAVININL